MNRSKRLGLFLALTLAALMPSESASAQTRGPGWSGWRVTLDPMTEPNEMMNRRARESGLPLFMDALSFEMSRTDGGDLSFDGRRALVDEWVRNAAALLEGEGFRIVTDAEMQEHSGTSMNQIRDMVIRNTPFGQRDLIEAHVGREMRGLLDEEPPGCPVGDNALMGYVMAFYPTEGVQSDYGSVSVMILGFGPCSSGIASRQTIARMRQRVTAAFAGPGH